MQDAAQVREVVKLTNVTVTLCIANFLGSLGSRGRCLGNVVNERKKEHPRTKLTVNK